METPQLREQLEELHRQLSETPDLDARGRETLAAVERDLQTIDDAGEREQVQSRWKSAVVDFEGSHPHLASGLEQMANLLSNFGL